MKRLEIRDGEEGRLAVFLDGERLLSNNGELFHLINFEKTGLTLLIKDEALYERIAGISVEEISDSLYAVDADIYVRNGDLTTGKSVIRRDGNFIFRLDLFFEADDWRHPYSIKDLCSEIVSVFQARNEGEGGALDMEEVSEPPYLWHVEFPVSAAKTTIKREFEKRISLFEQMVSEAILNVESRLSQNSIVNHFNFPEEIRSSCEQYLLFFVQFLKDVGVEATAELKHEGGQAGEVLFSVTPEGGKQALDKVRLALEVYLGLAQAPNMNPDFSASLEVARLQSQISFFQSQLQLAHATIQQKEAAIELKDALIAQIKSGTVFEEAQKGAKKKEDEEVKVALFKGLIHLKRYDATWIDVDIPTIYVWLRKLFDDENSTGDSLTYVQVSGFESPEDSPPALPPAPEE